MQSECIAWRLDRASMHEERDTTIDCIEFYEVMTSKRTA